MENIIPFLLTIIAGLSTLIGTIFIFFKVNISKLTNYSLSFAAGVMIAISLFDLIPESIKLLIKTKTYQNTFLSLILFITIGLIITYLLDQIIPENKNQTTYRVGVFSLFAIIIHNIPEGIATFLSAQSNITLGITLTIAIALHNIPEGISISVPIYSGSKNKLLAIKYTLISALAEPLGALLACLFLKQIVTETIMGYMLALIAGIMTSISLTQLLPAAIKYKEKKKTIIYLIFGMIFMLISIKVI